MISQAYKRREQALEHMARVKAACLLIHLAHRDWAVPNPENVPLTHNRAVQAMLISLLDELKAYLLTPLVYVRHYTFKPSFVEEVNSARTVHYLHITALIKRLSKATEVLKAAGLSGAEAQRLSGFLELLSVNIESLKNAKEYRNPQGIRAFSRFFLITYPFLYGSYYGTFDAFLDCQCVCMLR